VKLSSRAEAIGRPPLDGPACPEQRRAAADNPSVIESADRIRRRTATDPGEDKPTGISAARIGKQRFEAEGLEVVRSSWFR